MREAPLMKAVYIEEQGGVEVLKYGKLPEPTISVDEIKVRVRACSINRLDLFTRAGVRGTRLDLKQPHILGGDSAGDVVSIGSEVTEVKVGDRVVLNPRSVCGKCKYCLDLKDELCTNTEMLGSTTNGSYAEYVKVKSSSAIKIPASLSYEEAASLPTVFLPGWAILIRRAALKPTETVLVLSASSGVGTAAIQIAKRLVGAKVISTTSTDEKARLALQLGSDEVINYKKEDIRERVKELTANQGVDVVVDHVGADFWPAASASLALGGRYGICGVTTGYRAELQMGMMFLKLQTVFGVFMGRQTDLKKIVSAVADGVIRGVIHQVLPLEEVATGHEIMEGRDFFGKLILTM